LPSSLSYLHIPTLPQPILDTLFDRLWTLLQPTDPLLLAPLAKASVLEIDVLPSTIQVRAIWAAAPHSEGWRLDIPSLPGTRTEIGIFQEESGEDKDEYAIGGVRAILGQDREFTPTLFTFPHRDHILSSAAVGTWLEPAYGSHPNIRTILPSSTLVPPVNDTVDHESCTLHGLYTLSKEVFVDKYQLAQLAQFQSGGIADVRGVWGETDLENPTYKTEGWGSVVLLDVAVPVADEAEELVLELPVHLRYLEPSTEGGYEALTLLPPQLFWTCQNSVEGIQHDRMVADLDFSVSPFGPPSSSLLHTLFPSTAVFYHLPHHPVSEGALTMNVPVGNVAQVGFVQGLTALGILGGFTYLFVKGVRLGLKGLRWRGKGKEKAKDI
jgi:PIG-X / PBN1